MPLDHLDIKPLIQSFKKARRTLPVTLGQEAVIFFKDNILKRHGFLDMSIEKWKPLAKPRRGRTGRIKRGQDILKDTGKMWRRIKRVKTTFNEIKIGVPGIDYAEKHNEGIGVPQRKFIGESKTLDSKLKKIIEKEIGQFLQKLPK